MASRLPPLLSLLVLLLARPAALDLVTVSPPAPTSTPQTPAPSTTAAPTTPETPQPAASAGRPDVYSLHVESRIAHRYARTVVSSRLANRADTAQEARFSLVLPETAFISAFLIETEGKVYEAYVKEKEAAKKEYEAALASGQTAGHVAVSARDSNTFNVAVNVAPGQKVTFNLTYEELLTRRLGAYTHAVHVTPGQVVRDLRVDVYVEESRNLTELRVPAFRAAGDSADADDDANAAAAGAGEGKALPGLTVERPAPGKAHVAFAPTPDQQRAIARRLREEQEAANSAADDNAPPGFRRRWQSPPSAEVDGLSGQLVVQYDVERDPRGGEVLLDQGYFVHFFAPAELPPLPKHVVFVLDVSGSMEGRKVAQLKDAMATILDDLKPGDYFNLLEFSYSVTVWNLDSASNNVVYSPYTPPPHFGDAASAASERPAGAEGPAAYPATADYVRKAKDTVSKMTAGGGTNIHDALRTALGVARDGLANVTLPADATRPQPIIVFLTDGEPTVGESRPHKIFSMVSEQNEHPTVALFSLAFGDDADLPFLKKLSLRNQGFARKIYEAADAALQLRNFYRQVASPLLSNVTFEYTPEAVKPNSTTKAVFPAYFAGSELVVAGQVEGDATNVQGAVHGLSTHGDQTFDSIRPQVIPILEPWLRPLPPGEAPDAPGSRRHAPSLERLWAYLSIRQLLDEREANSGFEDPYEGTAPAANLTDAQQRARDAADAAKRRALQLALQYSFVTPLTSLVVVKPNGTSAADLEGASPAPASGGPAFAALGGHPLSASFGFGGGAQLAFAARPGIPGPPPPALADPNWRPPSTRAPSHHYSTTPRLPLPTSLGPSPALPEAASVDTPTAPEATEVATGATPTTAAPPALGTLNDLAWLTNSLNGTTGSLLVPLANGTHLYRLGVNEENQAFGACALPAGAALSAPAHCRHLPHCVLPAIRAHVQDYVRYFCSIDDFAGVCCPDNAFPASA